MMLLWMVVLVPAVLAVVSVLQRSPRAVLGTAVVGSLLEAGLVCAIAQSGLRGRVFAAGRHLMMDPLSTFNLLIVVGVFALSSIYAWDYFSPRIRGGRFPISTARRFGAAWFAFLGSMVLVLTTNNVGLMWVGMEATTLASVMLVCLDFDHESVQASWTYLFLCSVGIALALLGTFLFCAEAKGVAGQGLSAFLWTDLVSIAPNMRPAATRLAFVVLLVGYGTKAGLAPMHTWLPGAHSQAPTPVSAVLSGVLLNCAIYAISRYLPLTDAATGANGWPFRVLLPFGIVSIAVAAAFIVHEHDVKRLLAYHSVEHMGIIVLGLGVGGSAAALYHTLNHSVCKMLTFFCAGDLASRYGTRDMRRMGSLLRLAPLAGSGLVLGILVLVGAPPFAVFMSELWIVRTGLGGGHTVAVLLFLAGAGVVFIAAIKHAVDMIWQTPDPSLDLAVEPPRSRWVLIALPLLLLAAIGIWMPPSLRQVLTDAASVIGGQR
jgi:hydrogenase-4 component F